MDNEEFYQLATRLWGHAWASILANKLEVSTKSVKRWASGKNPIPVAAIELLLFHATKYEGGEQ